MPAERLCILIGEADADKDAWLKGLRSAECHICMHTLKHRLTSNADWRIAAMQQSRPAAEQPRAVQQVVPFPSATCWRQNCRYAYATAKHLQTTLAAFIYISNSERADVPHGA